MILEQINEPTVTLTFTVTELKRLRDACGWAIDGMEVREKDGENKEQEALQEALRLALDDVNAIYNR